MRRFLPRRTSNWLSYSGVPSAAISTSYLRTMRDVWNDGSRNVLKVAAIQLANLWWKSITALVILVLVCCISLRSRARRRCSRDLGA